MSNKPGKKKIRIDRILVDRGLASTRARAQAMILAGNVLVNDEPVTKAGVQLPEDVDIRLREPETKYVSRGAKKLLAALDGFGIQVEGKRAIDVGASTGGFTEVLLERGAGHVHAVDVGTNQLAWKIRNDPRVTAMENYNARYLKAEDFGTPFDILVMDVSFISIRLILPAVIKVLNRGADLAVLFKPQFEVGREWIGEGGIVKDQSHAQEVLDQTVQWSHSIGLEFMGKMESPITETDGNKEYLIHWRKQ